MIDVALDFLQKQLNIYLQSKLDPPPDADAVIMLNISQLNDGGSGSTPPQNAYMTLVNIEEDRVRKSHENFVKTEAGVTYKNPQVYLNLYVLFSVNLPVYSEATRRLALIIQFFQNNNVFDAVNHPTLDPLIDRLIVDLFSMSFEQLNHLWGILGGKYMPSVMYKVRQVTIDENAVISAGGFIKQIRLNEKVKQPIT